MSDGFYIKANVRGGCQVANAYDSINLAFPDSKTRRGRIGYGVAQTLTCADNIGVIIPVKDIGNENIRTGDRDLSFD